MSESRRLDQQNYTAVAANIPIETWHRILSISLQECIPEHVVIQKAIQEIADRGYTDVVVNKGKI